MPSAASFAKAFSIVTGTVLSGNNDDRLKVVSSSVRHVVTAVFERYTFPIQLAVEHEEPHPPKKKKRVEAQSRESGAPPSTSPSKAGVGSVEAQQQVKKILQEHTSRVGKLIVWSEMGSPFECTIGAWKVTWRKKDGLFVCTATGKALRRRDMETKAQSATKVEPSPPDLGKGVRVIRSRFSTSVCDLCSQPIDVGRYIAKFNGRWSHATCVAAKKTPTEKAHDDPAGDASVPTTNRSKRKRA